MGIQSALVDPDIRVHVRERRSRDPKLKKWPVNVQSETEDVLASGAKGMMMMYSNSVVTPAEGRPMRARTMLYITWRTFLHRVKNHVP